jgi:hypothetical protein
MSYLVILCGVSFIRRERAGDLVLIGARIRDNCALTGHPVRHNGECKAVPFQCSISGPAR